MKRRERKKIEVVYHNDPGYLFLGGPWDGSFKKLKKPVPYIKVSIPEEYKISFKEMDLLNYVPSFNIIEYEGQKICVDDSHLTEPKFYYLYVKRGMKIGFG